MTQSRWTVFVLVAATFLLLGGCGSSSSLNATPVIGCDSPPIPSCGLSPASITAGSALFTLHVAGSGFMSTSEVEWNGSPRTATYDSSSGQLSVSILAADVSNPGTALVTVTNPAPGGGESSAVAFQIEAAQPGGPVVLPDFSPPSVPAGGGSFMLTVNGSNFTSNDFVLWNGNLRTTSMVSSTQLVAQIANTDIATCGSGGVSVLDPVSGAASPSIAYNITGSCIPVPTIASLSPPSATAGGPDFTLTVNGTFFLSGAAVELNGSQLATTYGSAALLTATVPSSAIATAGNMSVTVANPSGPVSAAAILSVEPASGP